MSLCARETQGCMHPGPFFDLWHAPVSPDLHPPVLAHRERVLLPVHHGSHYHDADVSAPVGLCVFPCGPSAGTMDVMAHIDDMQIARFLPHLVSHCEDQFPVTCPTCQSVFALFAGYVCGTTPIGLQLFDSSEALVDPIGTLSLANCACGSTISLECSESGSDRYNAFIEALENDAKEHQVSTGKVLELLRSAVRAAATTVPGQGSDH